MRCYRCGCMMAYEKFYDINDDFFAWRCVCCGEIVDEVILNNRMKQSQRG